MSEDPIDDPAAEPPARFRWDSPRWQENEAAPGEVERFRRSRIDAGPRQQGALDQDGSVSTSAGAAGVVGQDRASDEHDVTDEASPD